MSEGLPQRYRKCFGGGDCDSALLRNGTCSHGIDGGNMNLRCRAVQAVSRDHNRSLSRRARREWSWRIAAIANSHKRASARFPGPD